jgi:hypothetical protein
MDRPNSVIESDGAKHLGSAKTRPYRSKEIRQPLRDVNVVSSFPHDVSSTELSIHKLKLDAKHFLWAMLVWLNDAIEAINLFA